jgi:hypothetical protein
MSGHALPPRDHYRLRNDASATFQLASSVSGGGAQGATVKIKVTRKDGLQFRLEIVFASGYASSKPDFDAEMYLETGLAIARSQIESHVHRDTRITLEVNSGLPRTVVGAALGWEDV